MGTPASAGGAVRSGMYLILIEFLIALCYNIFYDDKND